MDKTRVFKLRPYQEPITEAVYNYLRNNPGKHPLIALPTGSGKTVSLADLVYRTITEYPDTNVLILSHVKEILEQDYKTLRDYFLQKGMNPSNFLGLNSSGLGRRQHKQVTVAGIQSVYKDAHFRDYQLIIIDECHLIPFDGTGMYRTLFEKLKNARYVGLTATPFRLGKGYIFGQEDAIFDDLIYDLTRGQQFVKLIEDGYLSPLKTFNTPVEFDVTNIGTVAGDFSEKEMSEQFDRDAITAKIVTEVIRVGVDYKKWLIFAIDIKHAEHIAELLLMKGVMANVVHSRMEGNRDTVIRDFKDGKYRAIVNVNVLTTGFDDPEIDLIVLARPTQSPVLHVQTIGRGSRPCEGKDHCRILDFAGNTKRLGPVNDITPHRHRKGKKQDPIMKTCPDCECILPPAARICPECGHVFEFKSNLDENAGNDEVVVDMTPVWVPVDEVTYVLHQKHATPDIMKVTYQCGYRQFKDFICVEHARSGGYIAHHWCKKRLPKGDRVPTTTYEALKRQKEFKQPTEIKIRPKGKFYEVCDYKFY